MTIGIDLSEGRVRALTVGDDGEVVARSDHRARRGASLRDVLNKSQSRVGIALAWPSDEVPEDVAAAIAGKEAAVTIDAGAATVIAETWCGAARGLHDVVTFALGEEVTAGIMIEGKVLRGAHGYAGSVAWLSLNPVERADYRRFGGLGAEVAAAGIVRRVVWRIKSGDHSALVDRAGGDLGSITADQVFRAAHAGDGVCISVVRDTIKYVGMALSNIAAVLDPEAIVLGGTSVTSVDNLLEGIRAECGRRLRPIQAERLRIIPSTLGADAAAIGAARAAQRQRS